MNGGLAAGMDSTEDETRQRKCARPVLDFSSGRDHNIEVLIQVA